jgi:hypothetical protein
MSSAAKALSGVRKRNPGIDEAWFHEWRGWIAGHNNWPRIGHDKTKHRSAAEGRSKIPPNIKLTIRHLIASTSLLPEDIRTDIYRRSYTLAVGIVKHFLGEEWIHSYAGPVAGNRTFMQIDFGASDHQIQIFRTIDLAELLYNLQHIDGFDYCIGRLRQGMVESILAELDVARMLYINNQMFWFVEPSGTAGEDYDFQVLYPTGIGACIEAKCNVESDETNLKTIRNALVRAKKQLPNQPSIIFIKISSKWVDKPDFSQQIRLMTLEFLRTTKRVVSVKYYAAPFRYVDKILSQSHAFMEITNSASRFFPGHDWNLLTVWKPPKDSWNTMPPNWTRIPFFPDRSPPQQ